MKNVKELYCDESRQDLFYNKEVITENNRYIFIGGICIDHDNRHNIKDKINKLKKKYALVNSELKWNKITSKYVDLYKELIDIYVENEIEFRSICIDASQLNLKKFHKSNPELGFYKFYYQLLNNWLDNNLKYIVYTDIKTYKNPSVLKDLKRCLNNINHPTSIEKIYAIESKESVFLQLEDVIMGAASFKMNYGYSGKSQAKLDVMKYLESRIGMEIQPTPKSSKKFNLFNIWLRDE